MLNIYKASMSPTFRSLLELKDEFQITQLLKLTDHVLQYTHKATGKHRFIYMSKIRMKEMLTYYRVLVYDCDKFILSRRRDQKRKRTS